MSTRIKLHDAAAFAVGITTFMTLVAAGVVALGLVGHVAHPWFDTTQGFVTTGVLSVLYGWFVVAPLAWRAYIGYWRALNKRKERELQRLRAAHAKAYHQTEQPDQ